MNKISKRIKTYDDLSTQLSNLSNLQLSDLLDQAEHLYVGIGGKAVLLHINDTKIFVKKIPLTDIERNSKNIQSTANLYELPFSYHIGVGSTGFTSWRELSVHMMCTNWVISGEHQSFPILYHWRVLSTDTPMPMTVKELKKLESDVKYWDNFTAVRKRLESIHNASAYIYLFLEYVPQNLYKWLSTKLHVGGDIAAQAVAFVDNNLKETNKFMNNHGLLHFDAHFYNILADDDTIYVTDFGLSLHSGFELSKDEIELFNEYKTYDQSSTITNLLHCIISSIFGKDPWEIELRDYINGKLEKLEQPIANIIKRYAAIALVMDDFYQKMQKISKSTPYPAKQLEQLLTEIGSKNSSA